MARGQFRVWPQAWPFVVPIDGCMDRTPPRGCLPDREHVFGRFRTQLFEKVRELVDPLRGLPDDGIQEEQNALQHLELHPDCSGGNDNRLSVLVSRDFLGEIAIDAARALQDAAEFARIAIKRSILKSANQFAGNRHDAAGRFAGGDIKIDENEPALVGRGRKEKVRQVVLARFSACAGACRNQAGELFQDGRRSARVGGQGRRDDTPRLVVDGLNQPKRQLDKLGFLLGAVIGLLDVKVGDHAQQSRADIDAVPARQIDQTIQWIGRGRLHHHHLRYRTEGWR